ncbi:fructosamine kinase family protein [Chamaesiphon sp.]|uniref:fructosamine kinase family protein n=1 Tax=Chamaesiphon sp. TaxID=2814140 RepID=UPI0035931756
MWSEIGAKITQVTGENFEIVDRQSIGGGCINRVELISNAPLSQRSHPDRDRYLLKLNQPALVDMFAAEASGLLAIAATAAMRVPMPLCWGVVQTHSYLVLEYLDLTTNVTAQSWSQMGRNLAAMHQYRSIERGKFGWHIDNTIGATPQVNTWATDWTSFFTTHRIGYQFQLAGTKGGYFPQAAQLLAAIPHILAHHHPKPSLVHGDLWSGNASFTTAGVPIIFDPATYWGDREVDLAMTELFGGFPAAFYQGYNDIYPLDPSYSQRQQLYNLYHILNHYNLFGGNYQTQANRAIASLLK